MIRKSTGKIFLLTLTIAALVSTGYAQAIIKLLWSRPDMPKQL